MDLFVGLIIFVAAVVGSILTGISLVCALAVGCLTFCIIAYRRGFSLRELIQMGKVGARSARMLIMVMLILGLVTASWRVSGTIAVFVYYGMTLIRPQLFLVIAFLMACLLSYAMGTSFGVAGTVGVIFMALARSGGVDPVITAGVLMSGIMFGDRNSPVSSVVNLIASVTGTDVYRNVKTALRSGLVPFTTCLGVYVWLSFQHPIQSVDQDMMGHISDLYQLSLWTLLPATIMLILPILRINLLLSLLISWICGIGIAVFMQRQGFIDVLRISILGYSCPDTVLARTMNGGGLISMIEICGIILLACIYGEIANRADLLKECSLVIDRACDRMGDVPVMIVVTIIAAMVFCNQVVAVLMAITFLRDRYHRNETNENTNDIFIRDLSCTAHLLPALVPWNILCSVPLGLMGTGYRSMLFAVYIYALPVWCLIMKAVESRTKGGSAV